MLLDSKGPPNVLTIGYVVAATSFSWIDQGGSSLLLNGNESPFFCLASSATILIRRSGALLLLDGSRSSGSFHGLAETASGDSSLFSDGNQNPIFLLGLL